MYQFCDLELISTIIVSGAYLIYYLREESHIRSTDTSFKADVSHTIYRSLWSWHKAYFLKKMCLEHISCIIWCRNPEFDVLIPLGMVEWRIPFGSLWSWHWILASFLGLSCLEHISYISANFPQMCLMLNKFLLGHSSRVCDISCYIIRLVFNTIYTK